MEKFKIMKEKQQYQSIESMVNQSYWELLNGYHLYDYGYEGEDSEDSTSISD